MSFCPLLHKHTYTYRHTPASSLLRQNNCVPHLTVKLCRRLVRACIGSVLVGSIGKGQSGSVCGVTLSADWKDKRGSALSACQILGLLGGVHSFFVFVFSYRQFKEDWICWLQLVVNDMAKNCNFKNVWAQTRVKQTLNMSNVNWNCYCTHYVHDCLTYNVCLMTLTNKNPRIGSSSLNSFKIYSQGKGYTYTPTNLPFRVAPWSETFAIIKVLA